MESELKNKDFNVREFILQNFLQSDFTINLNKAQKQLSEILELQNKTFDEITTSVDNNLQDYVTISLQLTQLQEQLDSLTFRFNNVEQSVNYSQQQMQQQIYQIDVIVQNLKLVASLETGMKNLRKLINLVDFKIDESNYGIINSAINITKCKKLYSKIDSNPYIRQICHQHDIQGTISLKWQQVQNILEQEYVLSLQNKDGIRCQVLLQSFSIMELNKKADKLTIQFIIKPQLDQAYVKLLANKQALLSDSQPFEDFIQAVQLINKNNLFLSDIHQDLFQFKQILLELVYIYLSQKECSNIYSIAVPDLFQHNFKLIIDLKQQLNVVFEKGSEIEKKFLDKWNLQTYFLMRQTQIIKQFENQITQSYDQALQDNIQLVLSENVYLPQLKVKFYQFIIQLCNRFSIIVQEILKQPQKDVLPILNQVANLYQQKLTPIIKINELIKQKLHNLISEIIIIYQKQVVLECVQNLEPFNGIIFNYLGIPAKYRMTNKDFPTQSSNFCGNVFRPLQNSIQKLNDQFIQKLFSKSVCNDVMIAFAQIKKQAIDACDKNEELMQKMGVKKNESQDNLKIKHQFQLDEQDLLNQIENKFL